MAETNTNGDIFFGQLRIGPVGLDGSGTYEISFWVYMFCNQNDCNSARDSIKIILNQDDPVNLVSLVYNYTNIGQQRVWQKKTYRFNSTISVLDVKNHFNSSCYAGKNSLNIYYLIVKSSNKKRRTNDESSFFWFRRN